VAVAAVRPVAAEVEVAAVVGVVAVTATEFAVR
jgi:hypothetical protein